MKPNIILREPPETVEVLGRSVPINTGHRIWVMLQRELDKPDLTDKKAFALLLSKAYGAEYMLGISSKEESDAAVDAALSFFNFNEPKRPMTDKQRKAARIRSWDWDWDGKYAIADFQRYYGMDLSDPSLKMHWWRFWSLFMGLPGDSSSMSLIALRTADESGMSADQKKAQRERQRAHMLPARNEEEAKLNNTLRWGQDV